jgi:hypothetical protein
MFGDAVGSEDSAIDIEYVVILGRGWRDDDSTM